MAACMRFRPSCLWPWNSVSQQRDRCTQRYIAPFLDDDDGSFATKLSCRLSYVGYVVLRHQTRKFYVMKRTGFYSTRLKLMPYKSADCRAPSR